jgi:hypothetical protein
MTVLIVYNPTITAPTMSPARTRYRRRARFGGRRNSIVSTGSIRLINSSIRSRCASGTATSDPRPPLPLCPGAYPAVSTYSVAYPKYRLSGSSSTVSVWIFSNGIEPS